VQRVGAAVATALLSDLIDRGLDVGQDVLCLLTAPRAITNALRDVLGRDAGGESKRVTEAVDRQGAVGVGAAERDALAADGDHAAAR
jgi:hypothetical protein